MRTTKIGTFTAGLKAQYGEYNCGNKTTGRLELVVTDGKTNTNLGSSKIFEELKSPKLRDKIVNNFLEDLGDPSSFIALNKGCSYFPGDTGVYTPGVLIYADSVHMDVATTWYNNWKGLIELFETEPKFRVCILKSPILPNRYYGTGKPSRVWTIVLPSISKHVCFDKSTVSKEMKNSLGSLKEHGANSPLLQQELKQLGVA